MQPIMQPIFTVSQLCGNSDRENIMKQIVSGDVMHQGHRVLHTTRHGYYRGATEFKFCNKKFNENLLLVLLEVTDLKLRMKIRKEMMQTNKTRQDGCKDAKSVALQAIWMKYADVLDPIKARLFPQEETTAEVGM